MTTGRLTPERARYLVVAAQYPYLTVEQRALLAQYANEGATTTELRQFVAKLMGWAAPRAGDT